MGKSGGSAKADAKTALVFQLVSKEIGEGDDKKMFTLKYDPETERFDFSKDGTLLVSSCTLRDCVLSAEENKVPLSEEEKKISFKIVK
jgi:hypothetical protein